MILAFFTPSGLFPHMKCALSSFHLILPLLELCRLIRALRCVPGRVRMSPDARQLAAIDNEILVPNGPFGEPALQNLARPGGIAGLGRQRRARGVRGHAM